MTPVSECGLGDPEATFRVYLGNRPDIEPFNQPDGIQPLAAGDIGHIVSATGNHWRKIFNVYAKLLNAIGTPYVEGFPRWQDYRDEKLLQRGSDVALCFGPPQSCTHQQQNVFMGKGFAHDCGFFSTPGAQWLDSHFAVNNAGDVVCPYFDYRQLSDERIQRLVTLLKIPET